METIVSALEQLEYWIYRNLVYNRVMFKYESGYDYMPLGGYVIGNMIRKDKTDRLVHLGKQYWVLDHQFNKH